MEICFPVKETWVDKPSTHPTRYHREGRPFKNEQASSLTINYRYADTRGRHLPVPSGSRQVCLSARAHSSLLNWDDGTFFFHEDLSCFADLMQWLEDKRPFFFPIYLERPDSLNALSANIYEGAYWCKNQVICLDVNWKIERKDICDLLISSRMH